MTSPSEAELRKLAEAATLGPWFLHDFTGPEINAHASVEDVTVSCDHPATITLCNMANGLTATLREARANAAFIAAANPSAILSLLTELSRLRANQIPVGCVAVCKGCGRSPELVKNRCWKFLPSDKSICPIHGDTAVRTSQAEASNE